MYSNVFIIYELRHGSSATFKTKSSYCRVALGGVYCHIWAIYRYVPL